MPSEQRCATRSASLLSADRTLFLRNGEFSWAESLSELGVYGVAVRKGEEILMNKTAGYLLRTKLASSDEGGVAAGFAVLDSASLE